MAKRGPKIDKLWGDALRVAILRVPEHAPDKTHLALIAEKCVEAAMNGDMQAMKEIGDRLDGKPTQPIDEKSDTTLRVIIDDKWKA